MTRELVIATGNPHKVDEIRSVLEVVGLQVISLADLGASDLAEPCESGKTFAQNARIKAVEYARGTGRMVLADDSGLEVDALDGAPGVYSARWAGVGMTRAERDAANNAKLVAEMARVASKSSAARFVCAMCVAAADGSVIAEAQGVFEGSISSTPRGSNGFGYDPYFVVGSTDRTSAELTPDDKNARSHRGAATRAIARLLSERLALS